VRGFVSGVLNRRPPPLRPRSLPELWAILVLSSVALVLVSRPFFALVLRRAKVDGTLQLA